MTNLSQIITRKFPDNRNPKKKFNRKNIIYKKPYIVHFKEGDIVFIYILKLIKDKYYVGATKNPRKRFDQHFNKDGSNWTKKYKPIQILYVNQMEFEYENYITEALMQKYGQENVRGGDYCSISEEYCLTTVITQFVDSIVKNI